MPFPILYRYVSEETMILCNFNYDSSNQFTKGNKEYRVFLNMPIEYSLTESSMFLIIAEFSKNSKWYFRKIPNINQGDDGLGLQVDKYERFVNDTINPKYRVNPNDLEGILLSNLPDHLL